MKTNLLRNMFATIVALFISMFALPQQAQAESYDLKIAGVQVNSDNCNNLSVIDGVSGTVKYNPATKTLTLDNATINETGESNGIWGKIDGLTVQVKGTVSVTAKDAALVFHKSATLTGGGTLNATSSNKCGILASSTDLTIDGLTVNAKGKWGIAGENGSVETLTIRNATVTAEGNGTKGSICDFKDITLDGCAITQPAGAAFDESLHGVALGGELVTEKVVIEPVIEKYDLKIAGVQVTSLNCNDLTVIDGVSGTEVSYNPYTETLTLDNANIDSGAEQAIYSIDINVLTIKLIGNNKAIARGTTIATLKPMIITGDGTLDVESTSDCAIFAKKTALAIYGCTVNAKGAKYGIAGYDGNNGEDLIIRNATVTAEGNEYGSIRDIETLTLDGCAITQPAEAAFDASLKGVALNGQLVKEKVTISLLSASGFVIIDGVKKPILSHKYFDKDDSDFVLRFNLSDDGKEIVQVEGNRNLHIGKDIDLTKRENEHYGQYYWFVAYATDFFKYLYSSHRVFTSWGSPDSEHPFFTTGTLRIDGDPAGTFTVSLKNGRITSDTNSGDGEEHTIELICSIAPTGIDAVTADASVKKQGIYNLQGVKLNTAFDRLPAGVYIVDGKKVVKR